VENKRDTVYDVASEVRRMKRLTTCSTVVGTMLMLVAGALTFAQSEAQSTKQPYQPNGHERGSGLL
jgi:hypothetical protein